jgi:hypothetical protein
MLSPWRPRFYPRTVRVRSVVDKLALGQVFLPVIRFSFVSIIPPMIDTHLHLILRTFQASNVLSEIRKHWIQKYFLSLSPLFKGLNREVRNDIVLY